MSQIFANISSRAKCYMLLGHQSSYCHIFYGKQKTKLLQHFCSWLALHSIVYWIYEALIHEYYVTFLKVFAFQWVHMFSISIFSRNMLSALVVIRKILLDITFLTELRAGVCVWAQPAATHEISLGQEEINFIFAKRSFISKAPPI